MALRRGFVLGVLRGTGVVVGAPIGVKAPKGITSGEFPERWGVGEAAPALAGDGAWRSVRTRFVRGVSASYRAGAAARASAAAGAGALSSTRLSTTAEPKLPPGVLASIEIGAGAGVAAVATGAMGAGVAGAVKVNVEAILPGVNDAIDVRKLRGPRQCASVSPSPSSSLPTHARVQVS